MSFPLGNELSPTLVNFFAKKTGTVILATIDNDLHPHTAPFYYISIVDPWRIRIAVSRNHQTYDNILSNQYLAMAVFDEGDLAVCIKGIGRVILEAMNAQPEMAIVEMHVEEVRNNCWYSHFVSQGIRIHHKNELILFESKKIFLELKEFDKEHIKET